MDPADAALVQAWGLALENHTEEVEATFETLLPALIEAGYANADENTWRFTPKGVARAEELTPNP